MRRLAWVAAAVLAVFGLVVALAVSAGAVSPRWRMAVLVEPAGWKNCSAKAINERGQAAGACRNGAGKERAVLWDHGKLIDLGTLPGGSSSSATAINDRGQIVGSSTAKNGMSHAVLWQNGKTRDLGTLGGKTSVASSLNDQGQIVGYSDMPDGTTHAVLWQSGTKSKIGCPESTAVGINNRGQVIGSSSDSSCPYAFLWQSGKITDLAPSNYWRIDSCAINDRGWIVGGYYHGSMNAPEQAFLWQNGKITSLAANAEAQAINERGQIVGYYETDAGYRHGVVWEQRKMTDLGTLGGKTSVAHAINNHGQIVGVSTDATGRWHAVVWTLK